MGEEDGDKKSGALFLILSWLASTMETVVKPLPSQKGHTMD